MIRRATASDIDALAAVHVRSWQAAYRALIPDAYLDALSVEERAARWRGILTDRERELAVCELDGQIVGFANVGESRDSDVEADTGELMAIYLDPAVWRRGLGRQLVDWAKDAARRRTWARMTLWVLRDNAPARRFYETEGFCADGVTRTASFGGLAVAELRYAWSNDRRASRGKAASQPLSPPPSA